MESISWSMWGDLVGTVSPDVLSIGLKTESFNGVTGVACDSSHKCPIAAGVPRDRPRRARCWVSVGKSASGDGRCFPGHCALPADAGARRWRGTDFQPRETAGTSEPGEPSIWRPSVNPARRRPLAAELRDWLRSASSDKSASRTVRSPARVAGADRLLRARVLRAAALYPMSPDRPHAALAFYPELFRIGRQVLDSARPIYRGGVSGHIEQSPRSVIRRTSLATRATKPR